MNKKIFFSLLLTTSIAIHGMKTTRDNAICNHAGEMVLCNDLITQITEYLCVKHTYSPLTLKKDIRALSDTNKFLHDYYAQETVKQNIIRNCSQYRKSSDRSIACNLNCRAIEQKIEHFIDIVCDTEKQFTEQDLKESWYLNLTTNYKIDLVFNRSLITNQSLLYIAIDNNNEKKAQQIIDHAKELNLNDDHKSILLCIAELRDKLGNESYVSFDIFNLRKEPDYEACQRLFLIAEQLLQKNILVDECKKDYQHTALMYAVEKEDKKLARLLLEHGANPYEMHYNLYADLSFNAFTAYLCQGKNEWLQEMIDEIKAIKKT
jgi:ankyrin repeat protein